LNTLDHQLKSYTSFIEQTLDQFVPVEEDSLSEAVRYALLGGGKRIRPTLTLATTELFVGSLEEAVVPACAIEMIHTYSMIHDDLPCMDDDDFRRGKPSLHKEYDEATAVLAGDFLLTRAFEVIAEAGPLQKNQRADLIAVIAKASGGQGMIGGQMMDIQSEGKAIDLQTLQELHSKKTGALIRAAVECGCIISSVPDDQRQAVIQFAERIGLAFQVVDDVLDITAGEKKRGGGISSDLTNDKSTYVSLLGIEEAKSTADKLFEEAMKSLDQLPQDTGFLKELAYFIIKRDH